MKSKQNNTLNDLLQAMSYRIPLQVYMVYAFPFCQGSYTTYPVCPRCQLSMEREYQAFCDRCGQALGWDDYEYAIIVYR